jgi:hypothetical protein
LGADTGKIEGYKMDIEILTIRDKINKLCADGTRYGLSQEEKKDLALLLIIDRKYDSLPSKKKD